MSKSVNYDINVHCSNLHPVAPCVLFFLLVFWYILDNESGSVQTFWQNLKNKAHLCMSSYVDVELNHHML